MKIINVLRKMATGWSALSHKILSKSAKIYRFTIINNNGMGCFFNRPEFFCIVLGIMYFIFISVKIREVLVLQRSIEAALKYDHFCYFRQYFHCFDVTFFRFTVCLLFSKIALPLPARCFRLCFELLKTFEEKNAPFKIKCNGFLCSNCVC